MKSLKNIQLLVKILRIISLVVFILCIIGAAGCALALIIVPVCQDIKIMGEKTLQMLLLEKNVHMYQVYCGLCIGFVSCGVGIFLSRYNELFFEEELSVGTPFTFPMVKKTRKVALVNIIVSLCSSILAAIVVGIICAIYRSKYSFNYGLFSTIGFGLALLVISLFTQYGAEKDNGGPEQEVIEENK